jgi:hypothetical protein
MLISTALLNLESDGCTTSLPEVGVLAQLFTISLIAYELPAGRDSREEHMTTARQVLDQKGPGDLVRSIVGDRRFTIDRLERYIHG